MLEWIADNVVAIGITVWGGSLLAVYLMIRTAKEMPDDWDQAPGWTNLDGWERRHERGYSHIDGKQNAAGAGNKARPQAGRR